MADKHNKMHTSVKLPKQIRRPSQLLYASQKLVSERVEELNDPGESCQLDQKYTMKVLGLGGGGAANLSISNQGSLQTPLKNIRHMHHEECEHNKKNKEAAIRQLEQLESIIKGKQASEIKPGAESQEKGQNEHKKPKDNSASVFPKLDGNKQGYSAFQSLKITPNDLGTKKQQMSDSSSLKMFGGLTQKDGTQSQQTLPTFPIAESSRLLLKFQNKRHSNMGQKKSSMAMKDSQRRELTDPAPPDSFRIRAKPITRENSDKLLKAQIRRNKGNMGLKDVSTQTDRVKIISLDQANLEPKKQKTPGDLCDCDDVNVLKQERSVDKNIKKQKNMQGQSDISPLGASQNPNFEDNCFISIDTSRSVKQDKQEKAAKIKKKESLKLSDGTDFNPNVSVEVQNKAKDSQKGHSSNSNQSAKNLSEESHLESNKNQDEYFSSEGSFKSSQMNEQMSDQSESQIQKPVIKLQKLTESQSNDQDLEYVSGEMSPDYQRKATASLQDHDLLMKQESMRAQFKKQQTISYQTSDSPDHFVRKQQTLRDLVAQSQYKTQQSRASSKKSKSKILTGDTNKQGTNVLDRMTTHQSTFFGNHLTRDDKEREMKENILILGLQRPEMVADKDRVRCLIYPNDKFKVIFWDLLISVCLLITCILIPFNLAFSEYLDQVTWYFFFLYMVDAFFVVDIFINFNTAYVQNEVHVITNRKKIAIGYIKSWFLIDLLSVVPFDLIFEYNLANQTDDAAAIQQAGTDSKLNQYIRISRVSKLYKLIKFTRMFRILKLMKQRELMRKMQKIVRFGHTMERLGFFLMLLFLMTHFIGCLWIFIAKSFHEDEVAGDSWIEDGNYEASEILELYILSVYFTMQTLTTVGYGDFSITNTAEKIMTIILQLVGIISFSFIAGAITNIIHDFDEENAKNQEKLNVLNRLYENHPMPSDLYYALLAQIQNVDDKKVYKETIDFLDMLPFRLKLMTTKFIYRNQYLQVKYLRSQNENFLVWICPLLKQEFFLTEQYLYYQTDMINEIYFLTSGTAGFVLPLRKNVVYIEINQGDYFGEIDLVFAAQDKLLTLETMIEYMSYQRDINLQRVFTVQAIEDCTVLSLSTHNLQRMQKQFNSQFVNLFKGTDHCLQNALKQKGKTLMTCDKAQFITQRAFRKRKRIKEYYKQYEIDIPDQKEHSHGAHLISDHFNKKSSIQIRYFKKCKLLSQMRDYCYKFNYCDELDCNDESNCSKLSHSHANSSHSSHDHQIDQQKEEEDLQKQKSLKDIFKLIRSGSTKEKPKSVNCGDDSDQFEHGDDISSCTESQCSQTRKQNELEDKLREKMIDQNKMEYERMKKNKEQIKNFKMQIISEYNESDESSDNPARDSLQKRPNVRKPSVYISSFKLDKINNPQQKLKSQKTSKQPQNRGSMHLQQLREQMKKRKMSVADLPHVKSGARGSLSNKRKSAFGGFSSKNLGKLVQSGLSPIGFQPGYKNSAQDVSSKSRRASQKKLKNTPDTTIIPPIPSDIVPSIKSALSDTISSNSSNSIFTEENGKDSVTVVQKQTSSVSSNLANTK